MSLPAVAHLPMLSVQYKEGKDADFHTPLQQYIEATYGDDPSTHRSAIDAIEQLRKDAVGSGKDAAGRDLLYRYFGQLELLELHFPLGTDVKIDFAWADSFNRDVTTQSSPAFEKASVIFNLAACLSSMASNANRTEEAGLKTACNYFETAAGVFKYVSDHFLHAPSTDMSKDFLAVLVNVMLAQAQECFVEKVIMEQKKSAIIFKLASQASLLFQQAMEAMGADSIKNYCPPLWISTVRIKCKHYQSLANFHRGLIAETEGKYGEQVSRFQLAEQLSKENIKTAKDLVGMSGLIQLITGSSKTDTSPAAVLTEHMKAYNQFISQKLASASKDNDLIYHDNVPASATLPPLDKLPMAQLKKLTDVFPQLPGLVGADLFQSLVPMHVHEQSSVYSEQKDAIVRAELSHVGEADGELSARLASMALPASLDRLKNVYKQMTGAQVASGVVPKDAVEWFDFIQASELKEPLDKLMQRLEQVRNQVYSAVKNINGLLDDESRQWNELRVKHGDKFSQVGPETATSTIRDSANRLKFNIDGGQNGDQMLTLKYGSIRNDLQVLLGDFDKLEDTFRQSSMISAQTQNSASLLDIPVQVVDAGDVKLLEQVDDTLQKLYKIKKARADIFSELKAKVQNEDISQLLVLNKKNEANVFKVELEKFETYKKLISDNVKQQADLLEKLVQQQGSLLQGGLAKMAEKQNSSSATLSKKLFEARCVYEEVRVNVEKGIKYYQDIQRMVDELFIRCQDLLSARQQERQSIVASFATSTQSILQQRLSQMSIAQSAPPQQYGTPQQYQQPQQQPPYGAPSYSQMPSQPPQSMYAPQQNYSQQHFGYAQTPAPPAQSYDARPPSGLSGLPGHLQQPLSYASASAPQQSYVPQVQPHYAGYAPGYPPPNNNQGPPPQQYAPSAVYSPDAPYQQQQQRPYPGYPPQNQQQQQYPPQQYPPQGAQYQQRPPPGSSLL